MARDPHNPNDPNQRRGPALPITLLIVDDNQELGAALGRWFMLSEDFRWAGWLPGPDGIDAAILRASPRLVLIDWELPGVDTQALLSRLAEAHPRVTFAVLSGHIEADAIRAVLKAGASGYLSKESSPAELPAEARLLAEGKIILSPDAQQAIQVEEANQQR